MEVLLRLFILATWCISCSRGANDGFFIKHYSGLCLAVENGTDRIYLKKSCNEKFRWTTNSALMHIETLKCLVPETTKNDPKIIAKNTCNSSFSRFMITGNLSLRHVATRKCVQPYWGCPVPQQGENMVLHNECDLERLQFHLTTLDSECEPLYPYCIPKTRKVAKSSNCFQKEIVEGLEWHWAYVIIATASTIIIGQFIFIWCTYRRIVNRINKRDKTSISFKATDEKEDPIPGSTTRDVHVISMMSTEHDEFSDSSTSTLDKNESADGERKRSERPYINIDYNQNRNKKKSQKRNSSKDRNSKRLSKLSIDVSKMRHLFKIRKSYTLTDLELLKRISIEQHEYEEPISPVSLNPQLIGKAPKSDAAGEGSGYVEPDGKCVRGRSASVPAKFVHQQGDGYLQPVVSEKDKKKCPGGNSVAYVNLKPSSPLRKEKNLYDMPEMALIEEDASDCVQVESHTYLKILES